MDTNRGRPRNEAKTESECGIADNMLDGGPEEGMMGGFEKRARRELGRSESSGHTPDRQ